MEEAEMFSTLLWCNSLMFLGMVQTAAEVFTHNPLSANSLNRQKLPALQGVNRIDLCTLLDAFQYIFFQPEP